MTVRRNLILGFIVSSSIATGLYFLPKSVVSNKPAEVSSETSSKQEENQGKESLPEAHKLDAATEKEISEIRSSMSGKTGNRELAGSGEKLAKAYLKASQYDSAGAWFENSMKLDPSRHLEFEAGSAYFEGLAFSTSPSKLEATGDKVRKLLSAVDRKNPKYAEAQAKAAMTWVNSPTPMKGILRLREIASENPDNVYVAYQLGILSFQSGQFEKAVDRFRKVLSLESENVNAWFYLSSSLMQAGKKKEALEAARAGYRLAKEDDSKASFEELLKQLE
jgi:tetratricopeptide (TPR) repeat protein